MQDKSRKYNKIESIFALINSEYIIHRLAFRPTRGLATHSHWRLYNEWGGLYNEWGIRNDGIRGVNETPRRGGYVVLCFFYLAWLSFYSCCSGLGLDAKNLPFWYFWYLLNFCNHIFLRFLNIFDIFWIFFSLNLSFSYLQPINKRNIKS